MATAADLEKLCRRTPTLRQNGNKSSDSSMSTLSVSPYSKGICNDDFCVHRQWHSLTLVVAYSDTHLLNELVDGLDSFLQVVRDAVFILQIPGMCKRSSFFLPLI